MCIPMTLVHFIQTVVFYCQNHCYKIVSVSAFIIAIWLCVLIVIYALTWYIPAIVVISFCSLHCRISHYYALQDVACSSWGLVHCGLQAWASVIIWVECPTRTNNMQFMKKALERWPRWECWCPVFAEDRFRWNLCAFENFAGSLYLAYTVINIWWMWMEIYWMNEWRY